MLIDQKNRLKTLHNTNDNVDVYKLQMQMQQILATEKRQNNIKKKNSRETFLNNATMTGISEFLNPTGFETSPILDTNNLQMNVRNYYISNNRSLLSSLYTTHGIVRTILLRPIRDSFSSLPEIKAGQVNPNDTDKVKHWLVENNILNKIQDTILWNRLFGGSGLVVDDMAKDPRQPFYIHNLKKGQHVEFYDADLWELSMINGEQFAEEKPYLDTSNSETPYNFYGNVLHKTRVVRLLNQRVPSQFRSALRGWGASELEGIVGIINKLTLTENVLFELISETKFDAYFIDDLYAKFNSPEGIRKIRNNLSVMNAKKNYNNGILLDAKDRIERHNVDFNGITNFWDTVLQGQWNAYTGIPRSKIFGQSQGGLNVGAEDLENYYMLCEDMRQTYSQVFQFAIKIAFQVCCGFIPNEILLEWKPLRILSSAEETAKKDAEFNRLTQAFDRGIMSKSEYIRQINTGKLLPHDVIEDTIQNIQDENEIPTPVSIQPINEETNNIKPISIKPVEDNIPQVKSITPLNNIINKVKKLLK